MTHGNPIGDVDSDRDKGYWDKSNYSWDPRSMLRVDCDPSLTIKGGCSSDAQPTSSLHTSQHSRR